MSTDVTYFQSTDPNAPQLDGTIAGLVAVFKAVLIDGYGTVTVASLSVTDGLATAVVDAGHGFGEACVVEIAGANETAFNGRHKITVVSATQFAFPAGAATGAASGTITAKRAPVGGWAVAFEDAAAIVLRSIDAAANGHYIRIAAVSSSVALIQGYQTMSGPNTGTGATTAQYLWLSSASPWRIYADRRAFWYCGNYHLAFAGDLVPVDPADGTATAVGARDNTSTTLAHGYAGWIGAGAAGSIRVQASKDGVDTDLLARVVNCFLSLSGLSNTSIFYLAPGNSRTGSHQVYPPENHAMDVHVAGCRFWVAVLSPLLTRGFLPGGLCPIYRQNGVDDRRVYDADGRLWEAVRFRCAGGSDGDIGFVWLDLTGPWR